MELISAAKDGNFEEAFSLITAGTNLNARDKDKATPLYWSACRGNASLCEVLIQAGCDVNAQVKWGSTALHAAVDRGHFPCVEILAAWGAEINSQNNRGDTPLHISAYRGFIEIVKFLVKCGANVLLSNENHRTPQEEAAAGGHGTVANFLLKVMEEHVTKQQQHLLSWKVPGITRSTSFKGVHKTGSPQARFNADGARSLPSTSRLKPTHETSHLHPNNLSPLTDTSRTVTGSRPNMIRLNSKQECEYGNDNDSGVFQQENDKQFDNLDSQVPMCSRYYDKDIPTTPPAGTGFRPPPVYRRSVSAQENTGSTKLNDLHMIEQDPYRTHFAEMLYNVPPEFGSESEGTTNSFDSSYMSSTSDTSDSLNSTLTTGFRDRYSRSQKNTRKTLEELNIKQLRNNSGVSCHTHEEATCYGAGSSFNDVVVSLAQELSGCKQDNARLTIEKTELEKKVSSQQDVIKVLGKENEALRRTLEEYVRNHSLEHNITAEKPMTSYLELLKLIKETKTFGMSGEEKAKFHKDLQNFIKERFLSKAHTHSETQLFETPGKEWTPGRDYVILGDKPLNKVRQGHQPRSLSFLIKHIKTGRKLVLKIMVNVQNHTLYMDKGDRFITSSYLSGNMSRTQLVPEHLLELTCVPKILHQYVGPIERFHKFLNIMVKTSDTHSELGTRSLFLVTDYMPLSLGRFMSEINVHTTDTDHGSLLTFLTLVLYQILSFLDYLHERKIVHGNISCDNILLDNILSPVLIGFGNVCPLSGSEGISYVSHSEMESFVGNRFARAHEQIDYLNRGPAQTDQVYSNDPYTKSDMFTLGKVFYSLLVSSNAGQFYGSDVCRPEDQVSDQPLPLAVSLRYILQQMRTDTMIHKLTAREAKQRIGMLILQPSDHDVTSETDCQSYLHAKLLQILATDSCCFRVPEVKETVSLEDNIRLLTPLIQVHFLCNISSKEFWETLQDLRNLKPIPTLQ